MAGIWIYILWALDEWSCTQYIEMEHLETLANLSRSKDSKTAYFIAQTEKKKKSPLLLFCKSHHQPVL